MLTTALYTDGYSIRLCNPTTLLSEGEYGSYTDNVGGTYITKVINGVEWMLSNLNDKKFRNGDWIEGFNGGVYTPISNEDWETRGTAGESLMCYYDDNEAYGGGQIPLVDLLISEHNSLNGLDGGDPDNNFFGHLTEAELAKVQALGSISPKDYWSGTLAAYTAITTKDSNTIYFVEE